MEETIKATSSSVVCTLPDEELRDRQEDLRRGLGAMVETVRETDNGIELAFPARAADEVRAFVAFERECTFI